jgi:hypothetical protein
MEQAEPTSQKHVLVHWLIENENQNSYIEPVSRRLNGRDDLFGQ